MSSTRSAHAQAAAASTRPNTSPAATGNSLRLAVQHGRRSTPSPSPPAPYGHFRSPPPQRSPCAPSATSSPPNSTAPDVIFSPLQRRSVAPGSHARRPGARRHQRIALVRRQMSPLALGRSPSFSEPTRTRIRSTTSSSTNSHIRRIRDGLGVPWSARSSTCTYHPAPSPASVLPSVQAQPVTQLLDLRAIHLAGHRHDILLVDLRPGSERTLASTPSSDSSSSPRESMSSALSGANVARELGAIPPPTWFAPGCRHLVPDQGRADTIPTGL